MISIFFRLFFLLCIASVGCYAEITLERYSISTYVNTNYVDDSPGYLAEEVSVGLNYLSVIRVGFRQYSNPNISSSSTLALDNRLTLMDEQDPLIYGDILFYPNPFRLQTGAILTYTLNTLTNVNIQIFDIFGHQVYERYLLAGMDGAKMETNRLIFDENVFNSYDVPAGVYFLFLFDDYNQLIGKTKFAIVP